MNFGKTMTSQVPSGRVSLGRILCSFLVISLMTVGAETQSGNPAAGSGNGQASQQGPGLSIPQKLDPNARCEEITIPMCKGIGYNLTSYPNEMNHDTQEEAGLEVHQFWPLVEIKCSEDLKFFLCSMYTPICIEDYIKPLPACRSVCERARTGCAPLMQQYGFKWPERMSCERLPVLGDPQNLCMDKPMQGGGGSGGGGGGGGSSGDRGRGSSTSTSSGSGGGRKTSTSGGGQPGQGSSSGLPRCRPGQRDQKNCRGGPPTGPQGAGPDYAGRDCTCKCRHPLIQLPPQQHHNFYQQQTALSQQHHQQSYMHQQNLNINTQPMTYQRLNQHASLINQQNDRGRTIRISNASIINTNAGPLDNCQSSCRGPFFTDQELDFAGHWITLWSGLCCVSTLATLITFVIDTQRFKYPERPIVFLSACYFMVSIGYLTRLVLGKESIACDGDFVKYSTSGPDTCTLVFLLVYFFGMASSVWWVILTFTWFLAAGLKWGNEAIASYAAYFHLAAWVVPTIKSVAVIVSSAVDGDSIAGICYTGNLNADNLKIYVLIPLFAYLILGSLFLVCGFVSLFRIRKVIKRQGGSGAGLKADKLEKLMIRIGIFSVLYTVPASVVLGCHIYESSQQTAWLSALACPCEPQVRPLYSVVMLKYFMLLAVGITSGVWIWSGKTADAWRSFWRKICSGSSGGRTGMGGAMGGGMGGNLDGHRGAEQALIKQGPLGSGVMGYHQAVYGNSLPGVGVTSLGSMASASHHLLAPHVASNAAVNSGSASCCKQSLSHV